MKDLLRQLLARRVLAMELLAASLVINVLGLATTIYVMQVLSRYISSGVNATLVTLTTGVMLAVLMEFGFREIRLKLAHGVTTRPNARLAVGVFSTLLLVKSAELDKLPPAVRREVVGGISAVQQAYTPSNLIALLDLPFAFLFVGVLYLLSPIVGAVVTVFIALTLTYAIVSSSSLQKPLQDLTHASSRNSVLIGSVVQVADTVRAFNAGPHLRQTWWKQLNASNALQRAVTSKQNFIQSVISALGSTMSVVVIAVGAPLAVTGDIDVSILIGCNILAGRAMSPIVRFAQLGSVMVKARQALDLLTKFSRIPVERIKGSALTEYKGRLEFRDVAFTYSGASAPLFESFSFRIEAGSVLAVVGGNGSGKTTLARMLSGLLDPDRGQILVDDLNLQQVVPEWWRRQILYLPQEPTFFDGSIRENLMTVNPEIDDAGLNQAVTGAGLQRFLSESAQGFETPITNAGASLSLGIRRRLALARALTGQGRIAILDEPTEGMDADGRAVVYEAVKRLTQSRRTIVVFSHDPNIVRGANMVIDLDSKPSPRVVTQSNAGAFVKGKE